VETADVVLMKSDPFDVVGTVELSRATLNKMRQNLAWAVGYNMLAIPVAAGLFANAGLVLRPKDRCVGDVWIINHCRRECRVTAPGPVIPSGTIAT
jgi:Cu2+-exporting ATPase